MLGVEFNAASALYPELVQGHAQAVDKTFFKSGTFTYGQFASKVAAKCWEKNLLILTCGPYDVLRLIPPLNISAADLKQCLSVLEAAISDVVADYAKNIRN